MGIQNPVVQISKKHFKLKRTKSALKESSNKSQYKYKICKQLGYNSKTCKEKSKENQNNNRETS